MNKGDKAPIAVSSEKAAAAPTVVPEVGMEVNFFVHATADPIPAFVSSVNENGTVTAAVSANGRTFANCVFRQRGGPVVEGRHVTKK